MEDKVAYETANKQTQIEVVGQPVVTERLHT